jgi:hypothetical protein
MNPVNRNSRLGSLLIGAAICACNGASSTGDGAAPGPCDPARQDCPPGQTCDLICEGGTSKLMCRVIPTGGGLAPGEACTTNNGCGARTGCFATSASGPTCVRYCDTDADCSSGSTCKVRTVTRPCGVAPSQFMLKFCLP